MKKIVVVGGGAAGMIAAGRAAECGHNVILLEKNERLGKKMYITGKGRCNITNATDPEDLIQHVMGNPFFMYSSFYSFGANDTVDLLNQMGLATKVERGNRVFPVSDKSNDVITAFEKYMKKNGVQIRLNTAVEKIMYENEKVVGVKIQGKDIVACDSVIVATGGLSYPSTGSTGDGYTFAKNIGHHVTKLYPSLVPLLSDDPWVSELQGLSLKNVEINVLEGKRSIWKDFGEMLFTHKGISGPLVLTASRYLGGNSFENCTISIDLKPALSEKELDNRLLKDFEKYINKDFKNALDDLLPQKLIPIILEKSGIGLEKKVHDITKEERKNIVYLLKHLQLKIKGFAGYSEAVITSGGVDVNEINPGTMESKLVSGLFFAGEVLDVDALTGGFNLQVAFSTGYLAGSHAGD